MNHFNRCYYILFLTEFTFASTVAELPAKIGSHAADIMCHLTRTGFDPSMTVQTTCHLILNASLLNDFNFSF